MRLSTTLGLLVAAIGSTSLLSSCLSPATIAAVTLSTVTVRANAEHGLASVATPRSKQEPWHAHDDKPPLRSGDDDRSIPDRRVIKKAHLLMRGDNYYSTTTLKAKLLNVIARWKIARESQATLNA